jgi:hypothetical protein
MILRKDRTQPGQRGSLPGGLALMGLAAAVAFLPMIGLAQAPRTAATRPATTRPATTQQAPAPQALIKEYQDRRERLAPEDIAGHLALAEWCRDHKLYQQLWREAAYVVRLDSNNQTARTLFRLAANEIKAQNSQTRPANGSQPAESAEGEFLTPAQIQKLRFAEFLDARATPRPVIMGGGRRTVPTGRPGPGSLAEEFLQVRYDGKVVDEFLDVMAGLPDYNSRDARTRFLKAPATIQLQQIRQFTANQFENRIEIINNPLAFRQFEHILPTVTTGCGTLACHGGPNAQVWRLRTARPRPEVNLYTNFLILNRVHRGNDRLVNREKPEESLLLQFGLSPVQAYVTHPEPLPKVMFPGGATDPQYRSILAWIQNLRVPEPRTGISLPGYPEPPPPQFGGKPKVKE